MTNTAEERIEVADKLRSWDDDAEAVVSAVGKCAGWGYWDLLSTSAFTSKLADLIDPVCTFDTALDENGYPKAYGAVYPDRCSSCGRLYPAGEHYKYCPNCGCRIVATADKGKLPDGQDDGRASRKENR